MRTITWLVAAALSVPGLAHAMDCSSALAQPLRPMTLAPIATELMLANTAPGAPSGVLSQGADLSQSLDQVLSRIRSESCRNVANIAPLPGTVDPGSPAAYKPRTEFDNTPWRFNMSQNGKNMTADEFSAWMESKGVHVARGAAPSAIAPVAPSPVPATTPVSDTAKPPQP
jgi:hypothetical protein